MMKILSICIPTFNRSKKLSNCLDSIVLQFDDKLVEEVDVHIFDNDSTDNTEEVCKNYMNKYSFIYYHKKNENVGPDKNFLSILKSDIQSQFYHLMSDDDIYRDKIKGLSNYLKENSDLHFVYLNIEYFWENEYDASIRHKRMSAINKNLINLKKSEFIKIVKNELSFLSGMIFNSKYINSKNEEQFYNTNWLQSYMLFNSTINSNGHLGFFAKVTVSKRNINENPGYNPIIVFGENYYNLLKYAWENCKYNKKEMKKLLSSRWIKLIYWAKITGKNKKEWMRLIEIAKNEKMNKVILFSKLPRFIAILFHKTKNIILRRSN